MLFRVAAILFTFIFYTLAEGILISVRILAEGILISVRSLRNNIKTAITLQKNHNISIPLQRVIDFSQKFATQLHLEASSI